MGRTPCCDKNGLKKGPWTPEEDQKLTDYIQKHGYGNWRTLPKSAGLHRCGKSCRLRWTNYLRPDIKRGRFSSEEEETIIQLHSILGNKWSAIAARLPGRTDNEIKNYWNTHIRKRLLRMGIDPVTHSPRLDLLDISSILRSSLYNSSQMNLSNLLREQPSVNPELLKLVSSLVLSYRGNPNFCSPQNDNQQNHQSLYNPRMDNQIIRLVQADQIQTQSQEVSTPCVSYPLSELQFVEPNADGYPSNTNHLSSQDSQLNRWQNSAIFTASALTEDYVALPSYNYYASDQIAVDRTKTETSNFHSSSCNQNFGFTSVISTPSSSPTPLNSNSTIVNSSSSNDDERESYGSNNLLKFDIPDIIDVNYEFM